MVAPVAGGGGARRRNGPQIRYLFGKLSAKATPRLIQALKASSSSKPSGASRVLS